MTTVILSAVDARQRRASTESKNPYWTTAAEEGQGSFDCAGVRFANSRSAQDDNIVETLALRTCRFGCRLPHLLNHRIGKLRSPRLPADVAR